MNKIRLTVLSSVLAISAASFFYLTSPYTKKYVEVEGEAEKPAYSAHEGRYQLWQELHSNVNTGEIHTEDYDAAFAALNAMPQKKSAANLSFIEEGPNNVGGRTRGIAVDRNNTNIIYAGSVSGGLFKSTNKGGIWKPVQGFTDAINALGIGDGVMSISTMDITVDGTLYVGTGGGLVGEDGLAGGGSGSQGGRGIFMSKDGGTTFTRLAGTNTWDISRITAHPTQNKIFITGVGRGVTIYDGTSFSNASGISGSQTDVRISPDGNLLVAGGVNTYVSSNGGTSFTEVSSVSGYNARYAISHEKNANGKYNIYASMSTFGGSLEGIYVSTNSGVNWTLIGPGGSASFPIFGSGGQNQGRYDNIITAVKGRPNECIVGGIDLWHWKLATDLSNPSGQWNSISQWFASPYSPKYVHADQHEMTWDKDGNLYFGNDGGVFTFIPPFPEDVQYISFKHLVKNYNTVQFYSMSNGPTGSMLGGTQDNGTQLNNHTLFDYSSTYQVLGGDGFAAEISQINPDAMLSSIYYTAIYRSDDGGSNQSSVNVPCPAGSSPGALTSPLCGSFYTKFTVQELLNDANSKDSVDYVFPQDTVILNGDTYEFIYPSENFSLPLEGSYTNTTGIPVTFEQGDVLRMQDPVQALMALSVPGLGVFVTRDIWKFGQNPQWWKVLGPENGFNGSATALKFSRDGQYLYIGTGGGSVWRVDGLGNAYENAVGNISTVPNSITDGVTTYTRPYNLDFINNTYYRTDDGNELRFKINRTLIHSGPSQTVTDIAVDPNNSEHVVVTLGSFGAASNVLKSTSAASAVGTGTFSSINATTLPAMPAYAAVIDKDNSNKIYVGTIFGLFYTLNGGTTWVENNEQIGRVPVFAIRQDVNDYNVGTALEGAMYVATHGRGMWSTNKFLSTQEITPAADQKLKSGLSLYPNPSSDIINLTYELMNSSQVVVNIVTIEGKVAKQINIGNQALGKHRSNINVQDLPKGLYIVQVKTATDSKVAKFIKN
jgi:hypothetical protein